MAISSQSELFLKLQAGSWTTQDCREPKSSGGTCQVRIRSSTCKEFIQRIPYSVSEFRFSAVTFASTRSQWSHAVGAFPELRRVPFGCPVSPHTTPLNFPPESYIFATCTQTVPPTSCPRVPRVVA